MPQAYVSKLAKEHGVSTSKAEGHWAKAKAAAEKEGNYVALEDFQKLEKKYLQLFKRYRRK